MGEVPGGAKAEDFMATEVKDQKARGVGGPP